MIRGLKANLKDYVTARNWSTIAWPLSRSTMDGIEGALDKADFGAFILAANDVAIIRGKETRVPRANVVLELGMSFGRLGRDRTFILAPKGSGPDGANLSDLLGITVVEYEEVDDPRDTMSDPADQILEAIEKAGLKDHVGANGALKRGDTSRLDVVADGALYVLESRDEYLKKLRLAVMGGEKVPAKYQFAEADGGRHWMKLCRSGSYGYFERAKAHLGDNAAELAEKVSAVAHSAAIDFVSLGCGDGSKDAIMLQALAAGLTNGEYLYYYPIDISDILLVEAVRHVAEYGPDNEDFRCKPVLGDFTNLGALSGIVAHRDNANLFSLLGNALGSYDEAAILKSLARAMSKGDLVLLEANIGEPEASITMLQDDAANQWDLSTLAALDIEQDSCALEQEERRDVSIVPGTRTLVSYAVPHEDPYAVPHEDPKTKYKLSAMHHYNFEQLKKRVGKELNVEWVHELPGEGVCLLLGKRNAK